MRFKDARAAGRALAVALTEHARRRDALVIAVAHGGVGVGLEVAKALNLPLDLLLLRRLLAPQGAMRPACAASVAGSTFLDEEVVAAIADDGERDPALRQFVEAALADFDEHARAARGARPPLELSGRTVILVDNGVRTGSTMLAALRALRSRAPARVVVAAPVAAPEVLDALRTAADDFVHLHAPDPFGHVGLWYEHFARPSDEEIRAMLEEAPSTSL
ncbi:MAG TPA: phosphoribosyltransferase family protein [Pyrinomonadaceae bacterium]